MRLRTRVRAALARAALGLLATLAACGGTWSTVGGGTGASLPARLPPEIRVTVAGQHGALYLRTP